MLSLLWRPRNRVLHLVNGGLDRLLYIRQFPVLVELRQDYH